MDWVVKNALSRDTEREHLNKILAEIKARIDSGVQPSKPLPTPSTPSYSPGSGSSSGGSATPKPVKITLTGDVTGEASGTSTISIATTLTNPGIQDAPVDGTAYWRLDGNWANVPAIVRALSGFDADGFLSWDSNDGSFIAREIEGTVDQISVSNGLGIDANPIISLSDLSDSGTGSFKLITRDAKGRLSGTADGTTDDVPEGAGNLYYTDARADARVARTASTGLIFGGELSINALDNTKFDVSQLFAVFVLHTTPEDQSQIQYVLAGPFTGVPVTSISTQLASYIALDQNGNLQQFASPLTPAQRRELAELGAVIHSNKVSINAVNQIAATVQHVGNQLHDLMEFIGPLNITGNKYSANGANLNINVSGGTAFKFGANFQTDPHDPHRINLSSAAPVTFRYRLQNGAEYADTTSIDPNNYDVGGTLTPVPNNKFTVQLITRFQSGLTRIQYGQHVYNTLQDAVAGMPNEAFVTEQNIAENGIIRSRLVVKQGTTALNDLSEAEFFEVPKFGGAVASAGGALTYANIVAALGYAPVVSVNSKTGIVTLAASDVGADPAGTAASAIVVHEAASNPHPQYALAAAAQLPAPIVVYGGTIYEVKENMQVPFMQPITLQDDAALLITGYLTGIL